MSGDVDHDGQAGEHGCYMNRGWAPLAMDDRIGEDEIDVLVRIGKARSDHRQRRDHDLQAQPAPIVTGAAYGVDKDERHHDVEKAD
jgi:hypothetical protein